MLECMDTCDVQSEKDGSQVSEGTLRNEHMCLSVCICMACRERERERERLWRRQLGRS